MQRPVEKAPSHRADRLEGLVSWLIRSDVIIAVQSEFLQPPPASRIAIMSRPVRSTTPRKPYVPEPEAPSAEKPLRRSSEIVKLNALTSNQQEAFGDLPDDVRSELFGLDFDSWDDVKDTLKCTDEVVATIQKIVQVVMSFLCLRSRVSVRYLGELRMSVGVQDTVLSKKRKTEVKEEDGDVEGMCVHMSIRMSTHMLTRPSVHCRTDPGSAGQAMAKKVITMIDRSLIIDL